MAVAVAHALFLGAGVQLTEVNLLGTKIELTNPRVVPLGLWLLLSYFVLRYYQHFRDLNDPGPRSAFSDALGRIIARRERKSFEKDFPKRNPPEGGLHNPVFRYDMVVANPQSNGRWMVVLRGAMSATTSTGGTWSTVINDTQIPTRESSTDGLRAALWVAANTRYFTEYVLPIALAALPPIIAVVSIAPF